MCEDPDCISYIPDGFCAALAESGTDIHCSFCGIGSIMEADVNVSPNINQDGILNGNWSNAGKIFLSLVVIGMIIILLGLVMKRCGLMNFDGNMGWQYKKISSSEDDDIASAKSGSTVGKTAVLTEQV